MIMGSALVVGDYTHPVCIMKKIKSDPMSQDEKRKGSNLWRRCNYLKMNFFKTKLMV